MASFGFITGSFYKEIHDFKQSEIKNQVHRKKLKKNGFQAAYS